MNISNLKSGTLNKNISPSLVMIYNSTIIAKEQHHMFIIYISSCLKGLSDICNILVLPIFGAELTKKYISKEKTFFFFFPKK